MNANNVNNTHFGRRLSTKNIAVRYINFDKFKKVNATAGIT